MVMVSFPLADAAVVLAAGADVSAAVEVSTVLAGMGLAAGAEVVTGVELVHPLKTKIPVNIITIIIKVHFFIIFSPPIDSIHSLRVKSG